MPDASDGCRRFLFSRRSVFVVQCGRCTKKSLYIYIYIYIHVIVGGRKYLSPAANSLEIRIAGRQPKCLSPAANSLEIRIAGRQPKRYMKKIIYVYI